MARFTLFLQGRSIQGKMELKGAGNKGIIYNSSLGFVIMFTVAHRIKLYDFLTVNYYSINRVI